MVSEQGVNLATNGIEGDRLTEHVVSPPFQAGKGERVVDGIRRDQDLRAGQSRRDLGQDAFAVVLHKADPEQDNIGHPVRGFGKGLIEACECVGLAVVIQDELKRRTNDFVALDHENAVGFY